MIERFEVTDREQWLRRRLLDVTASDIPAVLGVNPDRSCAAVWAEKTGLIASSPQTEFLQYRLCQEGAVLKWLRQFGRPDWEIAEGGVYLRDPDIRLGCTPDAVAIDPKREGIGVVQIKTVREDIFERDWVQPDGKIILPLGYQLQTQCEAMLVGAQWAVVAVEVMGYGTGHFFIAEVELNAEVADRIKDVVVRFWADTEAGKTPRFDFDLDGDVINAMHRTPFVKDPPRDLTGDNMLPPLLEKRKRRKAYIAAAEKWVDRADAEIKDKIGDHETATLPGWKLSWKLQKREQRIMEATQFRVLRVTQDKEKLNGK